MSSERRFVHLDGLRGWAAVIVLLNHVFPNFLLSDLRFPRASELLSDRHAEVSEFLSNATRVVGISLYYALQDGELAVHIFFVLSGFVLSYAAVERQSQKIVLDQALRRYLRLTIPIVAMTLIAFALMTAGAMKIVEAAHVAGAGWIDRWYLFAPDFLGALRFALLDVYVAYDPHRTYNMATWTMGWELAGSFLVFALLLVRGAARVVAYIVSVTFAMTVAPLLLCFLVGMLMAEAFSKTQGEIPRWLEPVVVLFSLALVFDRLITDKLGHGLLRQLWLVAQATEAVALVLIVGVVRRAMRSRLSLALGELTYPLYLLHPLVLCSAGAWITLWIAPNTISWSVMTGGIICVLCLMAAIAFQPVEHAAVSASRGFAKFIFGRWTRRLRRNSPSALALNETAPN
jgi:peptidoglycan/LPS O-acetylase OafA/YrhL